MNDEDFEKWIRVWQAKAAGRNSQLMGKRVCAIRPQNSCSQSSSDADVCKGKGDVDEEFKVGRTLWTSFMDDHDVIYSHCDDMMLL